MAQNHFIFQFYWEFKSIRSLLHHLLIELSADEVTVSWRFYTARFSPLYTGYEFADFTLIQIESLHPMEKGN
jgi:hypothetical protein